MEFKKKLRKRLYSAVVNTVLGIFMMISAYVSGTENYFVSAFGIALAVTGAARVFSYIKITRSPESLRKREISETDERNIMISQRAKSAAMSLYLILSGAAVIVLSFMGRHEPAQMISFSICFMVVIYWVCWLVIRRRS